MAEASPGKTESRLGAALAALVATLAALWVAWPAPFDSSAVIGHWNHPDGLSNHWLMVWVAEQTVSGGSLLHNDRYYWPVGDAPLLAGNGAEGFLYLPFHLLFGWPLGVSAYCVLVLIGNGLAAAWAARRAGASPAGSVIAAAAFGCSPYVLQEMGSGRFTQADAVGLVLVLGWFLGLERDLREGRPAPGWPVGLLFGAIWGFTAALYWYYGYFAVLAVVATGLVHFGYQRVFPWKLAAAFVLGGALVVAGPLAWYLRHWSAVVGAAETEAFPHREAWGDALTWAAPIHVYGAHQGLAIAVPVLILAAVPLIRAGRERSARQLIDLQLVALVIAALLLARGPRLFGDLPDAYTLAYGWAEPLRRFWWPSRHLVLVHFAAAVLAARGASVLLDRLGRARWPAAVGLCALVPVSLHLADDLHRLPMSRWEPPAFYEALALQPDGVVAELPLSPRLSGHQQLLIYQLVHGKPLFNGHAMWVDRVRPDGWDGFVAENTFLSGWVAWEEGRTTTLSFEAADLIALREAGLRWITLNREYVPTSMRGPYERALPALFGAAAVGEGRARAYDLHRWTGLTEVRTEPMRLDPGARPANGQQPLIAELPASLGFSVIRDTSKPFQGLHPGGGGQPVPGAPRPRNP